MKPNLHIQSISDDTAQTQLDILCNWYEIDTSLENLQGVLGNLKKAISKGRIEIEEDNGSIVVKQNLKFPVEINKDTTIKTIIYREMDGKAKILVNNPQDKPFENIYNLMAELSGTSKNLFLKMKSADLGPCESLGALFFS